MEGRSPISAFVITFNEGANITRCLESLAFCDEIVVVDSFSTDNTVEIAKEFGAVIHQKKWPGYVDQKAFGLAAVSHEWVINLDADEEVSDELRENIDKVLREDFDSSGKSPNISGFEMNRVVHHLGRWWRNGGWYPEYRLRFFRKSEVHWGGVDPHEKPIPSGKTKKIGGELYHYSYKDLDDQFARLQKFSSISALEAHKSGRDVSIAGLIVSPFLRFLKFYFAKKGYREGIAGLVIAIAEANYTFMKYAKLWALRDEDQRSANVEEVATEVQKAVVNE